MNVWDERQLAFDMTEIPELSLSQAALTHFYVMIGSGDASHAIELLTQLIHQGHVVLTEDLVARLGTWGAAHRDDAPQRVHRQIDEVTRRHFARTRSAVTNDNISIVEVSPRGWAAT